MSDVTQFGAQDIMRVFTRQAEKGMLQYGKPLTTETLIDPVEYAKEELVDAFVYVCRIQMDLERARQALEAIVATYQTGGVECGEIAHRLVDIAARALGGQEPAPVALPSPSATNEARYRRALRDIMADYENLPNAEVGMYRTAAKALDIEV